MIYFLFGFQVSVIVLLSLNLRSVLKSLAGSIGSHNIIINQICQREHKLKAD